MIIWWYSWLTMSNLWNGSYNIKHFELLITEHCNTLTPNQSLSCHNDILYSSRLISQRNWWLLCPDYLQCLWSISRNHWFVHPTENTLDRSELGSRFDGTWVLLVLWLCIDRKSMVNLQCRVSWRLTSAICVQRNAVQVLTLECSSIPISLLVSYR